MDVGAVDTVLALTSSLLGAMLVVTLESADETVVEWSFSGSNDLSFRERESVVLFHRKFRQSFLEHCSPASDLAEEGIQDLKLSVLGSIRA